MYTFSYTVFAMYALDSTVRKQNFGYQLTRITQWIATTVHHFPVNQLNIYDCIKKTPELRPGAQ